VFRIDPVKFNRTVFLQSISLQNSALALIFYAIAMVVNLVMIQTEDYLRMTQYNATNSTTAPLTIVSVSFDFLIYLDVFFFLQE
jgi:hypothetical protein